LVLNVSEIVSVTHGAYARETRRLGEPLGLGELTISTVVGLGAAAGALLGSGCARGVRTLALRARNRWNWITTHGPAGRIARGKRLV
jgi:hypothetical protein